MPSHFDARSTGQWPWNNNHEAARRHVDQVLRNHGWTGTRRETQIATLLDTLVKERDDLREKVYKPTGSRYGHLDGRQREDAIRESNMRAGGDPYGG